MAKIAEAQIDLRVDNADKARMSIQSVTRSFRRLGFALAGVAAGITALGVKAVKMAGDLELLEVQFTKLIGSASLARKTLQGLDEFAATTPFQFVDIAEAAKILLVKTNVEDLQDELRLLGDLAAGTGARLEDIALIMTKTRAKGKVELESLNQFAERGIDVFTELATVMGKDLPEVFDSISRGEVQVRDLEAAITALAGEGGRFAGSMADASETLNGQLSTISDNIAKIAREIGKELLPIAKSVTNWILENMPKIQMNIRAVIAVVKNLGASFKLGFLTIQRWVVETFDFIGTYIVTTLQNAFTRAANFFDEKVAPILNRLGKTGAFGLAGMFTTFGGGGAESRTILPSPVFGRGDSAAARNVRRAQREAAEELAKGFAASMKRENDRQEAKDPGSLRQTKEERLPFDLRGVRRGRRGPAFGEGLRDSRPFDRVMGPEEDQRRGGGTFVSAQALWRRMQQSVLDQTVKRAIEDTAKSNRELLDVANQQLNLQRIAGETGVAFG